MLIQDCGSCHGLQMRGGLGPPLLPEALADKPDSYLLYVIQHGLPGTAMPPWQALLSEAEVAWMVSRLRTGVRP
jgi:cytochrome c55X